MGEGLGRGEVENAGALIGEERGQARQPHGEGLARGGPGGDDDVLAAQCRSGGFGLVGPRGIYAAGCQPVEEHIGGCLVPDPSLAWSSRQAPDHASACGAALEGAQIGRVVVHVGTIIPLPADDALGVGRAPGTALRKIPGSFGPLHGPFLIPGGSRPPGRVHQGVP